MWIIVADLCQDQRVVLNLVHDGMSTHGRRQVYKHVSLFIASRELHLMKIPDIEAIFSVVCSGDIVK